jgi:hypothetical protein
MDACVPLGDDSAARRIDVAFLLPASLGEGQDGDSITVVQNWHEEFRDREQ